MQNDGFTKIEFDFRNIEAYEIAAILFSLIAYPPTHFDDIQVELCSRALVTKYLKWKQTNNTKWATTYQNIRPVYLAMQQDEFEQIEKKFNQTLQNRFNASFIVRRWLEDESNENTKAKKRQTIQTYLNELSEYRGIKDIENIRIRVWRKSISAIHLAMSFANANRVLAEQLRLRQSYFWFFENQTVIKEIINHAADIKEAIVASKIKISSTDLMDISYLD